MAIPLKLGSGGPARMVSGTDTVDSTFLPAVSTSAQGACPQLPNDSSKFLNGAGAFAVPSGSASSVGVRGAVGGLAITVTSSTAITVACDEIILRNSSNAYLAARAVSVSIATGTSGASGLDTGSIAASTWYAVHIISNGTTTAALLSLSATSPTLPSGYTYFARVGWVRTGTNGLLYTIQRGCHAQYVIDGTQLTALPTVASGTAGTQSTTTITWATVSVSSFVPSTAYAATFQLHHTTNAAVYYSSLAPNSQYGGRDSGRLPPVYNYLLSGPTAGGVLFGLTGRMLLESTNVFYASNDSTGKCTILGWEDNL